MTEVALVIVCQDYGDEYAVFSSLETAKEWADEKEETCVVVFPFVVDCPEFGNTGLQ